MAHPRPLTSLLRISAFQSLSLPPLPSVFRPLSSVFCLLPIGFQHFSFQHFSVSESQRFPLCLPSSVFCLLSPALRISAFQLSAFQPFPLCPPVGPAANAMSSARRPGRRATPQPGQNKHHK